MSGYEDAPATRMLATNCACCGRPLVDAVSVETGVGPECRKKHGFGDAQAEPDWTAAQHCLGLIPGTVAALPVGWNLDARQAVNVLVYRIASEQEGPNVLLLTDTVRALGFIKLADRITKRLASVRIELDAGHYIVRAPYSEAAVEAFRTVPGRRWVKDQKANVVPASSRRELFAALRRAYPGETACGPRGLFQIEAA